MKNLNKIGEKNLTKRNKKAALIYLASFLAGLVMIIFLIAHDKELIKSERLIIIGLSSVFVFVIYLNWIWYKNMDEFEKNAIGKASFWGISFSTIILPWAFLNELGITSKPDALVIIFLMLVITMIIYYYEKFSNR